MMYVMPQLNQVYEADALAFLRGMPDASVGCVVTSPPYNMRTLHNGAHPRSVSSKWGNSELLQTGFELHDDAMPHADYVQWQRDILTELLRLIPDDGAIFYNHKWRIQGGLLVDTNDIVNGFPVRQIIIVDRGSTPNLNNSFFMPIYEVIYLICKPKFRVVPSRPRLGDVWRITAEANSDHPAPFPLELARRCIVSTTARVVLDPFAGSGTTLDAAAALPRLRQRAQLCTDGAGTTRAAVLAAAAARRDEDGGAAMKAITIHQPYATLLAWGAKQFETRHWSTDYRGKIAIHAGKSMEVLEDAYDVVATAKRRNRPIAADVYPFEFYLLHTVKLKYPDGGFKWKDFPTGAIVAVADLTSCAFMTDDFIDQQSDIERAFGNWHYGRYAWRFANVECLDTPIPARGQQGLWEWEMPA